MNIIATLELCELRIVHLELLLHSPKLLLSRHVFVAPVIHLLQVAGFHTLGIADVLGLAYIRKVLVVIPVVVIVHALDHLLQVLDALLKVAELLDTQLFDDTLLKGVFLDCRLDLMLSTCNSHEHLGDVGELFVLAVTTP